MLTLEMLSIGIHKGFLLIVWLILSKPCDPKRGSQLLDSLPRVGTKALVLQPKPNPVVVGKNIKVEDYFQYLDSVVEVYDSLTPYHLTEHLLVRANPWIIDSLQNTDYYRMKSRNVFAYDQKKLVVLHKGVSIIIPDSIMALSINNSMKKTWIEVNIPEFKLRIYEDSKLLFEFPIRVGQNEKKFLKMADRIVDLRTKTGSGKVVNHIRYPKYINPVDNHEYFVTKRDDKNITKMPQIPFIETEIDGVRDGQLIHPTTNPETLGKAYSNGCMGTNEADAWVIYYYAPINTKIVIRYDLNVLDKMGNEKVLKDIYNYNSESN